MSLLINDLKKTYRQGQESLTILSHLNLEVKTSEIVAVVGASGSGKSTFLSLVAGLDYFDDGDIVINNQSIKKLNRVQMTHFRAQNIGFVFQQFHLVSHLTAYENLCLPLEILDRDFNKEEILTALDNVGLAHRVTHKPTEMSGGECQRLALARGLIARPSLLLADEPSGNLDSETGAKVMNLFFEQVRSTKTTTVLVTHDMELAKRCDRLVVLKNGNFDQSLA
ncbi:ABC transporter ATP-binding protein [Pseudobdellovibrio exovorus]|uniref:ABC-type transporter, ATP-binding protein n=1 Tax=Pseudobdellovibrio exovorus JSS TaxID=1184267 RepID=M4VD33_9BACT|nr:ABC transporter ATP-binding protein [Pseudobdellovibrio exovorus]AGH96395.1 ABC-type transporter, ATP-binding protein [Pseudobdellovibrio exovorus JSS]